VKKVAVLSHKLKEGQIRLNREADFRMLVPPNESDPGNHFSQP